MREYFRVSASKYDPTKNYDAVCPASLNNPKDNSVMFITKEYIGQWNSILKVKDCIVFWPKTEDVPDEVQERHAIIKCQDPRQGYALFFRDNNIP